MLRLAVILTHIHIEPGVCAFLRLVAETLARNRLKVTNLLTQSNRISVSAKSISDVKYVKS